VKIARESALATRRAIVAGLGGCAAAGVAGAICASWPVAALCGFDVAALVFVLWVWLGVARADAARTERIARAEDASPTAAEGVLVGAGAASLVAVTFTLAAAGDAVAPGRAALHHALLSYLFGTVIVAVTVTTVAGLVT
jgi:uncharacterized membrane protein